MSQNLVKHKAECFGKRTKVTTEVGKRKTGRIIMLVMNKFVEMFRSHHKVKDLEDAFKDDRIKSIV